MFERIANSFGALKENVMKQTVKFNNKKKSLLWKGNELPRSLMTNALSATRLSIWPNISKIKAIKETLRKELFNLMSLKLITLLVKF